MSIRALALIVGSVIASFSLGLTLSASAVSTPSQSALLDQACTAWNAKNKDLAHATFRKLSASDSGFANYAVNSDQKYKFIQDHDSFSIDFLCS